MKNDKGFAVLESLLILIIIAIIGGTGWYVLNAKHKTDNTYSNSTSVASSQSVSADPLKPFTAALKSAGVDSSSAVYQMNSYIKTTDSQTAGYKLATVGIKSGPGSNFFYSKDNGKTWVYFTHTSQEFSCDMFKTADQKAAYKGVACADISKPGAPESKVE